MRIVSGRMATPVTVAGVGFGGAKWRLQEVIVITDAETIDTEPQAAAREQGWLGDFEREWRTDRLVSF